MMTLLGKGTLRLGAAVGGRQFHVEGGFLQVADNQVRVVTERATAQ
jgi:F-type H+-transporting ATPase subunit epsilon